MSDVPILVNPCSNMWGFFISFSVVRFCVLISFIYFVTFAQLTKIILLC